ncbi:MAG: 50S ribosomal protein L9 [Pseudomonadota bacterium]
MKIILKERVASLGSPGEVVEVARGYARNFLLPTGKALEATRSNIDSLSRQKDIIAARAQREQEKAEQTAQKIASLTCTLRQKAGDEGRLFGSVTTTDIAGWLVAQGVEIDRKRITVPQPIKEVGEHTVVVKLTGGVLADLKVIVEKEA